jgi:hypothetical protein
MMVTLRWGVKVSLSEKTEHPTLTWRLYPLSALPSLPSTEPETNVCLYHTNLNWVKWESNFGWRSLAYCIKSTPNLMCEAMYGTSFVDRRGGWISVMRRYSEIGSYIVPGCRIFWDIYSCICTSGWSQIKQNLKKYPYSRPGTLPSDQAPETQKPVIFVILL